MKPLEKGAVVYHPYKPKFVGVVRSVQVKMLHEGLGIERYSYEVAWEDGTVSDEWEFNVNSLDALIEKHRKAIVTHEAAVARAWKGQQDG